MVIIVPMFREIIGIEYLNEVREMNHWAFGPHHMWTDIVTGDIIRYKHHSIWQSSKRP